MKIYVKNMACESCKAYVANALVELKYFQSELNWEKSKLKKMLQMMKKSN